MKKDLKIDLVSQPLDSYECGAACASMIFNYYDRGVPYETINARLPVRPDFGLYIYEIGSYCLELGYDVSIKCFNTHFMGTGMIGKSSEDIKNHINEHRDEDYYKEKWRSHQTGLDTLIDFIDQGGQFIADIPVMHDIKASLDDGHPVLAAITTSFLYNKYFRHNEHFAVISGYEDNRFLINDPGVKNAGAEKHWFAAEHVMYGIYANASRSVEGGSIMTLAPR